MIEKKQITDTFFNFNSYSKLGNDNSKYFALVTGGCGRVGSVFVSVLLNKGYNVIVLSRTKKNYKKYIKNLDVNLKKKILWKNLDITNPLSIKTVASALSKKKIKILVNNAASSNRGKFFKYNAKNLNKELWGTFAGSMFLTEQILPKIRKIKNSTIIYTGSLWGIHAPRFKIYKDLDIGPSPIIASGKAALLQYAKFLAVREADYGVRINSILPGWFPRKGKVERKDYIKRIKDNIPLNRVGKLNDLVSSVKFLISDESSYVTGHQLIVDGGYSLS